MRLLWMYMYIHFSVLHTNNSRVFVVMISKDNYCIWSCRCCNDLKNMMQEIFKLPEYDYLLLTFVVYDKMYISNFELLNLCVWIKGNVKNKEYVIFVTFLKTKKIKLLVANNVVVRSRTIRKIKNTFVEPELLLRGWNVSIYLLEW
jgi:hypothetical protein